MLFVAVLVSAGAWAWVTLNAAAADRLMVGIAGGVTAVLLCGAATFAAYRDGQVRHARANAEAMERELSVLADDTLPLATRRLSEGASADTVLAELETPANGLHLRILRLLTWEISVGQRQRAAAMAACASAAGRVQALATSMLADLREMQNRHSEEVLGDLMKLDHATAQAGRLADSIAVLTGARSGRRWTKPIVMESILRGAMGRIRAYQRVRVHSASNSAIVGYAAEDIMHALAELMDNATRFSAPTEEVHVYVEDLHAGVVVTIEDGGLGMKPQALQRAEAAVSAAEPLDLTKLSGTRLGLAVVGALSRKHHLQVFFRPSSRGGTGVVMRIPNQLVTHPPVQPAPPEPALVGATTSLGTGNAMAETASSVTQPVNIATVETAASTTPEVIVAAEPSSESGKSDLPDLPKRRRGQTMAAAAKPPEAPRTQVPKPRVDAAKRFGAFREGTTRRKTEEEKDTTGGET